MGGGSIGNDSLGLGLATANGIFEGSVGTELSFNQEGIKMSENIENGPAESGGLFVVVSMGTGIFLKIGGST